MRAPAVITACLMVLCARASADAIDTNVRDLSAGGGATFKVRLAAALALSKSHDGRAVIAESGALEHDDDATIRRVAALALIKMVDEHTDADAMELALAALHSSAATDPDAKVRDAAERTAKTVEGYAAQRKKIAAAPSGAKPGGGGGGGGDHPAVFVNVDTVTDQTRKLAGDSAARLTTIVRKGVEQTGYATSWPGGLPTQAELGNARAFIVASTVKTLDITKSGHQTQIACTVAIRVAPWGGKDGGERWEANKAASASGSAKAMTGTGDKDIEGGVRDCIEAVGEDITSRQVVPFLKKLATAI